MAWYEDAVFYHIYPLGLTGAPKQNDYGAPVHRLRGLWPWISHIRELGCGAVYIGPLFESVGHGYETTDYRKLDSRLGTNEDLAAFVQECHAQGLKVIFDGVFNHTGRDFFAFQDLKANRENSPYRDWYCNVNFWGNNEYNDGFSYENWGGYNLLAKLNQRNPAVREYICDVIRFWVREFDVDGLRLDAADVLDFEFMKALRVTADQVKPDFWLMGEVIHGDYSRWANDATLHSVTNYMMHKALYSGHNDQNYFEIAHTIRHIDGMTGGRQYSRSLYAFVDNHDVERIATKLREKAHFAPVHILLYTLPGIPSVYYGSEFGIDGEKHRGGSDDAIRPSLHLADFLQDPGEGQDGFTTTARVVPGLDPQRCESLIRLLGRIRKETPALCKGNYEQRVLTNRQFAFARVWEGQEVLTVVNNDAGEARLSIPALDGVYRDALSGKKTQTSGGRLEVTVPANGGQIWVPADDTGSENRIMASEAGDSVMCDGSAVNDVTGTGGASGMNDVTGTDDASAVNDVTGTGDASGLNDETGTGGASAVNDASAAVGEETTRDGSAADADVLQVLADTGKREETAGNTPMDGQTATAPCGSPGTGKAEESKPAREDCKDESGETETVIPDCPLEEMDVPQLQAVILKKLAANGPVTPRMKAEVSSNIWKNSLLNWARSF